MTRQANYNVLNSSGKEIQVDVALHPGEVLLDELEVRAFERAASRQKVC